MTVGLQSNFYMVQLLNVHGRVSVYSIHSIFRDQMCKIAYCVLFRVGFPKGPKPFINNEDSFSTPFPFGSVYKLRGQNFGQF